MTTKINRSFLKWIGGKGRVIPQLLKYLPQGNRLIEPFVGAGNVFINTDFKEYILADLNLDLINVYECVKNDYQELLDHLTEYFNCDIDYYTARERFNNCNMGVHRAALFIYLNRHCFNGICRYNKMGNFNVPEGKHKTIYLPKSELANFNDKLNKNLNNAYLHCCDYQEMIRIAADGDVVYCDPPYLPIKGETSFNGYTPTGFDYAQTERLAHELYNAAKRGASVVVSNHNTEQTRYLFRQFKIHEIEARRSIAANGNRQNAKEIIAVLTPDMV